VASLKEHVDNLAAELTEPSGDGVIHLQTLRKAIGFVALGLPITLAFGEVLRGIYIHKRGDVSDTIIEGSMSAYYHTGMREIFVGSLCAIAIFLICYKGYEKRDDIAANFAGFSLLIVAMFPTTERLKDDVYGRLPDSVTLFSEYNSPDPELVGKIHFAAATVFFLTLAGMSLFLFTLSIRVNPTPRKWARNKVYVACGLTILGCIIAIALSKLLFSERWNQQTSAMFWLEAVAVMAFGISWLTKAQVILPDRQEEVVTERREKST